MRLLVALALALALLQVPLAAQAAPDWILVTVLGSRQTEDGKRQEIGWLESPLRRLISPAWIQSVHEITFDGGVKRTLITIRMQDEDYVSKSLELLVEEEITMICAVLDCLDARAN